MADKVKPLKIENPSSGGTQTDFLPTESDPTQDYLAAKGIAFENSDAKLFDLSASGEIQYKDAVQTTYKKLNDITGGSGFDEDKIISNHTGDVMTNFAGNVMRRS
jgi:hypothetical protein